MGNLLKIRQEARYRADPSEFDVHERIKRDKDLRDFFYGDSGSAGQDDPRISESARARGSWQTS